MQSKLEEPPARTKPPSALEAHPSVVAWRARSAPPEPEHFSFAELRALALAAGADDAALVSLEHPDLAEEKPHVLAAMPDARSLVSFVLRMHPDNIRSPNRTLANLEFQHTGHEVDEVARRIALALTERGHRALNPPMAFPMEMNKFPRQNVGGVP